MAHWAAVNSATGEVMWTQNPATLGPEWECHKLSRKPTEFDQFDPAAKALVADKALRARAVRTKLPLEERVTQLEDQLAALAAQIAGLLEQS